MEDEMQELHEIPSRSAPPPRSAIYPFPRVESQKQSGAELKEDGGKREVAGRGSGQRIKKAGRSTMIQTVCEFYLTG